MNALRAFLFIVVLAFSACSSVPSGSVKVAAPAQLLGHWKYVNPYRSLMSGNPFDGTMKLQPNLEDWRQDINHDTLELLTPELTFTPEHCTAKMSGLAGKPKAYEVYRRPDGDFQITGFGRVTMIYSPKAKRISMSHTFKSAGQDVPFQLKKE